jgi:3-oxoacyl-[acyl-carrier-protein] synthase II
MESGPRRVSPLMIPKLMTNAASGQLSIRYGFTGPTMAVSSACASGSNAIGEAFHCVRKGMADVQVCGGSEAAITPLGMSGFAQMRALSSRNEEPEKASRPFDKDRDGFVMGEGAGILVLESLEHARDRGAPIVAEITGYGTSSDASHITQPDTEGRGAKASMRNALEDADMAPESIDYINAHGTATPAGDHVEVGAVREVFGDHVGELAMSSTKSMIGHLLGASGAVEGTVTIRALREDICPPTINLDEPGEKCWGVDLVPHEAEEKQIDAAMSNSFGFGGHNVSLIFTEYEG